MSEAKLTQQIDFIIELDKLKSVLRKTSPINQTRKENSAEHSWQVILMALILAEHSNVPVNILRVLKMLAVHDAVEIDTDDTFHYNKIKRANLLEDESNAADRIFSLLPEPQRDEYRNLWQEFEEKDSSDAKFAACIDRLVAFILNSRNQGGTWTEFKIGIQQVIENNQDIKIGSEVLWQYAKSVAQRFAAGVL
jgi:putative hydrolase of HD superfamily